MHGEDRIIPRVAELFSRNLAATPDGRYVVSIDRYHAPVDVADTAFFVRRMMLDVDGGRLCGVRLVLSDGTEQTLDGTTLMQSGANVLYCRVPCRVWNDAQGR